MTSWPIRGLVVAGLAGLAGFTLGAGPGCGPDAAAARDGREVFALMCATCHGPDGRPPPTMMARLGVRDLTAPEFRARATEQLIEHQVRAGSKNKLMPAFSGALSEDKIKAVAAFVASPDFGRPAAPK